MEKHSLCFDCANAYAHRCRKILDGTPVQGWRARELKDGGYMVEACPHFEKDWDHRISAEKLGKFLGITGNTVQRTEAQKLIERVRKKGYRLKIQAEKTYRSYYIYRI